MVHNLTKQTTFSCLDELALFNHLSVREQSFSCLVSSIAIITTKFKKKTPANRQFAGVCNVETLLLRFNLQELIFKHYYADIQLYYSLQNECIAKVLFTIINALFSILQFVNVADMNVISLYT